MNLTKQQLDYDNLECPFCNKLCIPVAEGKNGTIRYERHRCYGYTMRSFSIDINGNLKFKT